MVLVDELLEGSHVHGEAPDLLDLFDIFVLVVVFGLLGLFGLLELECRDEFLLHKQVVLDSLQL